MTLISIDPGTSTCGVVLWDIDDNDFSILGFDSLTITIDKSIYLETRINTIYKILKKIMVEYRPFQLVHESGFMDKFRPMAYGPIYATIYHVRQTYKELYRLGDDRGIFMYSPKYVKAMVNTGEADKVDMFDAVTNIDEIKPFLSNVESEHVIDAIAIGYTHIVHIRENPELLLL